MLAFCLCSSLITVRKIAFISTNFVCMVGNYKTNTFYKLYINQSENFTDDPPLFFFFFFFFCLIVININFCLSISTNISAVPLFKYAPIMKRQAGRQAGRPLKCLLEICRRFSSVFIRQVNGSKVVVVVVVCCKL